MTGIRTQEKKSILQSNELNEQSQETNQNMIHLRERKGKRNTITRQKKKVDCNIKSKRSQKINRNMIHLNRTGNFFFKDAHLARYPTLCARESYLKLGLISFLKVTYN